MTHDRCSEVLPAFVREELQPELADEVRAHLTGCTDCRAEERAVRALVQAGGPDARPLDDVERARLHRGIAQEIFTVRANADVAGAGVGSPRWKRWIVPAATAAAVLAAVAVTTLGGGLGGSDSETAVESAGQADGGGGDAVEDSRTSETTMESKAGRGRGTRGVASAGAGAEADLAAPPEPLPSFDPEAGAITSSKLADIGRGDLFLSFAAAYRPDQAGALYDPFLGMIEDEAAGIGPRIRECAQTLPRDEPLIPAYGGVGEYRGDGVLLLGFVTSDPGSRRLNRSLLWVWDVASCELPVGTLLQEIDPGR